MKPDSDPRAILTDPRLARVRSRDRSADGTFVYAVSTTGVYCRPSCPARPARPENIAFYDTPAKAAQAGFRPCKRCKPDEGASAQAPWIASTLRYLETHVDEPVTLTRLATLAGISPFHLQRSFKAAVGVSPKEYHASRRLAAFKGELRDGADVLGATFGAGYGSTSRAYEAVDGGLGMMPSAYRAGGAGETISHTVRDTALGPLMMAATDRGVCFVEFGDDAAALLDRLAREFPKATLVPASDATAVALDAWMAALDAHLGRGAALPDLPLDLRGTAFQVRVWRFLRSVPRGSVVSYGEVAEAIGAPKAVRAAASACGANRIAVLVPCHRALRGDGALGGYRWGLERKRALLDRERREAAA